MATKQIKTLNRERGNVKSQVTRLIKHINADSVLTVLLLENMQSKLDALEQTFNDIQNSIEEIDSKSNHDLERETFENLCFEGSSILCSKIQE